jgi:hypothetical protein
MAGTPNTAKTGYGTKFEVEYPTGTWTKFGDVRGITPPNFTVGEEDATHLESPDNMEETIPGMINPGDMSLTLSYVAGDAKDAYYLAWRAAIATGNGVRNARITYRDGTVKDTFTAFPKTYQVNEITPKGAQTCTLGLKVAGAVARTP